MMSVVYLMIGSMNQYQFRQSCHFASIHTIPFHPILDELYVDCIDFFASCKRNWTSTRESLIPGTLQMHSLLPGRPMPGSRGCEGACYICMYIHTPYLHLLSGYLSYDFFFLSDRQLHLKYFSQNDCLHISSTATFPISPGCPTGLYQKRHSRSIPPSSQVSSTLRSPAQSSNTG